MYAYAFKKRSDILTDDIYSYGFFHNMNESM